MVGYLLDTNLLIELLRGRAEKARERLARAGSGLHVSAISAMELRFGAERAGDPQAAKVAVDLLLQSLKVVDFDLVAAEEAAWVRAALAAKGSPIGAYDTLLAGHARSLGLVMVTSNTREFARVPGLAVEDWLSPNRQGTT
jgi:tRNA(fMet)-specific endonuclease VapC